jgi:hypothetical protein
MEDEISARAPTERKTEKTRKIWISPKQRGLLSAGGQANEVGFCAEFRGFPSELVKENNSED